MACSRRRQQDVVEPVKGKWKLVVVAKKIEGAKMVESVHKVYSDNTTEKVLSHHYSESKQSQVARDSWDKLKK